MSTRGADQAELLPRDREDEVGVLLGHEAGLGLRAVEQALAEDAAVADRDPGLGGVVAGAARVEVGVGERHEPVELVVLRARRSCTASGGRDDGRRRTARASQVRRAPETAMTPKTVADSTSMVPRSGCSRISAAGRPAIASMPTTSRAPTSRCCQRPLGALGDQQRHADDHGELGELRRLDRQPAELRSRSGSR